MLVKHGGDLLFATLYSQIGALLAVAVILFAFLKGDEAERIGAGTYALGTLASLVIQSGQVLSGPQWGLFAVDLVAMAIYVGLAWKSRRVWPVWASALQALVVVSHLVKFLNLQSTGTAYVAVVNLSGLGVLIALGVGTFWAWQERRAAEMSATR